MGNGVTNWKYDGDPTLVVMAFYHGMAPPSLKKRMASLDCSYFYLDYNLDDSEDENQNKCLDLLEEFLDLFAQINVYDLYKRCYTPYSIHEIEEGEAPDIGVKISGHNTKSYTPWIYKYNTEEENPYGICSFGYPLEKWF